MDITPVLLAFIAASPGLVALIVQIFKARQDTMTAEKQVAIDGRQVDIEARKSEGDLTVTLQKSAIELVDQLRGELDRERVNRQQSEEFFRTEIKALKTSLENERTRRRQLEAELSQERQSRENEMKKCYDKVVGLMMQINELGETPLIDLQTM